MKLSARVIFGSLLGGLFLWLFLPGSCLAAFSFSITDIQPAILNSKEQEASIGLDIKGLPSESYFRVAWKKGDDTGSYFGYVKDNNGDWQKIESLSSENCSKYFKVSQTGDSQITLTTKIGSEENTESGSYLLRVHRFTLGCSATASTNSQTIELQLASSQTPLPTADSSTAAKAICEIKEVKDGGGVVLSSVKVYVDGNYTHHLAPETLTFCDSCPDGGFGLHVIKLEKSGYDDWVENRELNSGSTYEINAVMNKNAGTEEEENNNESSDSQPSAPSVLAFSIRPSVSSNIISAKAKPASSSQIKLPTLATPSAEVLGEATVSAKPEKENKSFFSQLALPIAFCAIGIILLGISFYPRIVNFIKKK